MSQEDKPYTHYMPEDENIKDLHEIETMDLMLEKLGDIENVLRMNLEKAHANGESDRDDLELANQLLVKIAKGMESMQNMKLQLEGVDTVTLQGKPGEKGDKGEDGKDCSPEECAAILKESEDFIAKIKGQKGDTGAPGQDGKTPVKGKDYFTKTEIRELTKEITDAVGIKIPKEVSKAIKEAISYKDLADKIVKLLPETTVDVKNVKGLREMLQKEIEQVYEQVSKFANRKHGGGGAFLLTQATDIDFSSLVDGYVLKYDAVAKRFYFGPVTGGSGTYYENIGLNIQNGATVITTGYKGLLFAPNGGTIRNYKIQSYEQNTGNDITGSIQITVKKNGSAIGTIVLVSQASRTQTDLSAWSSTTLSRGDKIEFIVDSATGVKNVHLSINFELA